MTGWGLRRRRDMVQQKVKRLPTPIAIALGTGLQPGRIIQRNKGQRQRWVCLDAGQVCLG